MTLSTCAMLTSDGAEYRLWGAPVDAMTHWFWRKVVKSKRGHKLGQVVGPFDSAERAINDAELRAACAWTVTNGPDL
jgi:hypothetical protein